jgi:ketosteroid isomerase-like protein
MRASSCGLLILLATLPPVAAAPDEELRALLDRQAADWNRGDIGAFMQGYEDSEETTFVGRTVVKGYQGVLRRYRERYPTRQAMGTLRFSDIEIRLLGGDYACATGRFHLERVASAGGRASGLFSLILRKTPQGWKIIHDHTS